MRGLAAAFAIALSAATAVTADAAPAVPDTTDWLGGLTDGVIADLAAGKPLVVEVHVPLCDSSIIACGNAKLGDGDNPDTNLYWSTTPGFGEWFGRRGGGWQRVLAQAADATGDRDVLAVRVYRRTIHATPAWRKRGAPATFELDIAIHGWRGKAIDRALASYATDLSGTTPRMPRARRRHDSSAGRRRRARYRRAWAGHNRLMDLEPYAWPAPSSSAKGAIAIACHTAAYMQASVPAPTRDRRC